MTETCIGCGLTHKDVEARGIWYCPNPLCRATGAAWFRGELKSFCDKGGHHTIDPQEWLDAGLEYLRTCPDEAVRIVGQRSARELRQRWIDTDSSNFNPADDDAQCNYGEGTL